MKVRLITHAFSSLQAFALGDNKRIYSDTCRQQNHAVAHP